MNFPLAFATKVQAVFLLALAGWLAAPNAQAQSPTVITALPYTISAPGEYVLNSNLTYNASSGNAITFATGNVTMDFQGHFISGLAAGAGTFAVGLQASDRANITIKNGTIVGFFCGIFLTGTAGGNNVNNIIENTRTPSNTFIGIWIQNGITCRIENCDVNKIGGSTLSTSALGINVSGGAIVIRNNQVSTVTAAADGTSTGMFVDSTGFVVGNQVDNCQVGFRMGPATKYLKNLTFNVTTPFSGGTAVGHNN